MATMTNPGKPLFATLLAELAERARGLHPARIAGAVGPSLKRVRQQVGPAWTWARERAQPLIERAQPLRLGPRPLRRSPGDQRTAYGGVRA